MNLSAHLPGQTPRPIRVFVAEDHQITLWGLHQLIDASRPRMEMVGCASTLDGLLREASNVLEGNPSLEMEDYGVGPKPIPGDGEPVFGELPSIPRYFVAFSHSGATLGLIAGELLADEIATGHRHPLLAGFRPGRFSPSQR